MKKINVDVTMVGDRLLLDTGDKYISGMVHMLMNQNKKWVIRLSGTTVSREINPITGTTTLSLFKMLFNKLGYEPNYIIDKNLEQYLTYGMSINGTYQKFGINNLYELTDEQEEKVRSVNSMYKNVYEYDMSKFNIKLLEFEDGYQMNTKVWSNYLETQGFDVINIMHLDSGGRSGDEGYLIPTITKRDNKYYPSIASPFDDTEYTPHYPDDYVYLGEFETYDEAYNKIETTIKESISKLSDIMGFEDMDEDELECALECIYDDVPNNTHVYSVGNAVDDPTLFDDLLSKLPKLKESKPEAQSMNGVDGFIVPKKDVGGIIEKFPTINFEVVSDE